MNRSVANAINLRLISELSKHIEISNNDKEVAGVVLTSTNNKFFSIGFDIPELIELTKKDFREFYTAFNQICIKLYNSPKPLIAAITGHAVAGGCILTLCCDYRFIAEGRKLMGLNEILLGVPIPFPALCILQHLAGSPFTREVSYSGQFYHPRELLRMGLVDKIVPQKELIPL